MQISIKVLINVHLLVSELCEYQNARCNDKKKIPDCISGERKRFYYSMK